MRSRDQRSGQVISQLPELSKSGMDFVGGDSPVANQVVSFFLLNTCIFLFGEPV